nr:MAG TPA: hypothetical protein [Caudoviricetes sp.]
MCLFCVCVLMLFRREMRRHFLFTRIPFRVCDFRIFSFRMIVYPSGTRKALRRKQNTKTSVIRVK